MTLATWAGPARGGPTLAAYECRDAMQSASGRQMLAALPWHDGMHAISGCSMLAA